MMMTVEGMMKSHFLTDLAKHQFLSLLASF
jgi:hypothetical protein